jgi:hypothetical protein
VALIQVDEINWTNKGSSIALISSRDHIQNQYSIDQCRREGGYQDRAEKSWKSFQQRRWKINW